LLLGVQRFADLRREIRTSESIVIKARGPGKAGNRKWAFPRMGFPAELYLVIIS